MIKRLEEDGDAWAHHEFGVDGIGALSVHKPASSSKSSSRPLVSRK